MRYAWIQTQRDSYPLGRMCRILQVSRSGYYAYAERAATGGCPTEKTGRRPSKCLSSFTDTLPSVLRKPLPFSGDILRPRLTAPKRSDARLTGTGDMGFY